MLKKFPHESEFEYKERIQLLIKSILPYTDFSSSPHNDDVNKKKETLGDDDWRTYNDILSASAQEIYEIGVTVLNNSSCLRTEKYLEDLILRTDKQIEKFEEERQLLDLAIKILKKRYEFINTEIEYADDYESLNKLVGNSIKTSDLKNLAETVGKSINLMTNLLESINNMKIIKDSLKASRQTLKNG